jgi:hypothetical protein
MIKNYSFLFSYFQKIQFPNILKISFFLFLFSNISYGQVTENFDNWTDGSYGGISTYGEWVSDNAMTENQDSRSGKCVRLRNATNSYLQYVGTDGSGKDGGVGVISFWYRSWDASPTAVYDVQVSINGAAYTNVGNQISTTSTSYAQWSHTLNSSENDIKIKIINVSGERLKVDDFEITDFASSNPSVTFDAATSAVNETDADVVTSGIPVTLTNYAADVTITPTVNGSSTAEAGDYTIDLTPLTFSGNETKYIPLTIKDDLDSDNETVIIDFTVTSGTADLGTIQHTITISDDDLPQIVISEIMYNTPNTDDEWIEIYNAHGSTVDISSWTIVFSSSTFTFPESTNIGDGQYISVALGSNGDGTFNNNNPFTPDQNNLSVTNAEVANTDITNKLGNSSGTITLKNSGGSTIDTVFYDDGDASSTDGNGPSYEIIDITADNSSTASNWQASAINGGSPGKISTTTWSGATDNNWNTSTNWSSGLPSSTSDILIPNSLSNYPTASSAVTVNSVTMISGSSLIAQSTFSGNVTYNRTIDFVDGNLKGWYLLSSPVVGQDYNDDYVTANDIASNGTNRGIATYTTTSDSWAYHQGAGSGSFIAGKGYSLKRQTNTGTVSFTGTLNTNDAGVDVTLDNTGNRYNLLGNPYTSSISSATLLGNGALSETQTIWIYDQTSGTNGAYAVSTLVGNFILAPGQGFFVKANEAGGTVNFSEANQSHSADTFQKSANTEIKLKISVDGFQNYAKIYYLDNATKGFDVGYEGEVFGGVTDNFSIYSQLLSDNIGKKYQVQSLPNSDFENMVIPIGIKAAAGKEIRLTADALNLPEAIKVFLEDREENTFTRLDELNASYKITTTSAINGVGRFYLHTTQGVLNINDAALDNVSVFKVHNSIRIVGLQQGKAAVKLFNVLGKQVLNTAFESNGTKDISLPSLAKGVYIVQLETVEGKLNKKIVLE